MTHMSAGLVPEHAEIFRRFYVGNGIYVTPTYKGDINECKQLQTKDPI